MQNIFRNKLQYVVHKKNFKVHPNKKCNQHKEKIETSIKSISENTRMRSTFNFFNKNKKFNRKDPFHYERGKEHSLSVL